MVPIGFILFAVEALILSASALPVTTVPALAVRNDPPYRHPLARYSSLPTYVAESRNRHTSQRHHIDHLEAGADNAAQHALSKRANSAMASDALSPLRPSSDALPTVDSASLRTHTRRLGAPDTDNVRDIKTILAEVLEPKNRQQWINYKPGITFKEAKATGDPTFLDAMKLTSESSAQLETRYQLASWITERIKLGDYKFLV